MKSNQKGFTLIELLAVIVILAIIALIATPIVLNIINKAKKSAAADSVYGVMEALKLAYTESLLDEGYELPLAVEFSENSNQLKQGTSGSVIKDGDKDVTLKISGTAPKAGTITIDSEGHFADATGITVNGITCSIESQKVKCGS